MALATRAGLLEGKSRATGKTKPAATEPEESEGEAGPQPDPSPAPAPVAPDREAPAGEIAAVVTEAVGKIDAVAVAAFFGAPESAAPDDCDARRRHAVKRKAMTTQHDLLRDFALLRTEVALQLGRKEEARRALLEAQRWEAQPATPGKKWREMEIGVLRAEGHLGLALQTLQDHVLKEEPLERAAREKLVGLLRELGWSHWADREAHKLAVEKGTLAPRF